MDGLCGQEDEGWNRRSGGMREIQRSVTVERMMNAWVLV